MTPAAALRRPRTALLLFLGATLLTGMAGGLATEAGKDGWYERLAKPDWTPPDAAFPIVWTALYVAMAVAAWRVWRKAGWRQPALRLFWTQLAVNFAWSFLFFAWHRIGLALADAAVLLILVAATAALFLRIDRPAGLLMIPYLAWTGYAVALNWALWRMNG
ncbi:MAG TPA: TspO/MBR family protein [Alphaproteobacteria bacterium]